MVDLVGSRTGERPEDTGIPRKRVVASGQASIPEERRTPEPNASFPITANIRDDSVVFVTRIAHA